MYTLNCKGRLLAFDQPIVMGIINVTPDSFFAASRSSDAADLLHKAAKMLGDGATILDLGGQSTRPGALQVGVAEEIVRVVPAIEVLAKELPAAIIAVDTYHAEVASAAVEAGASIVNDISGGMYDAEMLSTVGRLGVPYVCMHMRGTPGSMPKDPVYEDVTREVLDFFIERMEACSLAGIKDLVVDPGFGFGKTMQQNFELVRNLALLQIPGKPILLGVSRKSTICKTLGITAAEALNGTTVLNTAGLLNGAAILRVHDVKQAREAILLVSQLNSGKFNTVSVL